MKEISITYLESGHIDPSFRCGSLVLEGENASVAVVASFPAGLTFSSVRAYTVNAKGQGDVFHEGDRLKQDAGGAYRLTLPGDLLVPGILRVGFETRMGDVVTRFRTLTIKVNPFVAEGTPITHVDYFDQALAKKVDKEEGKHLTSANIGHNPDAAEGDLLATHLTVGSRKSTPGTASLAVGMDVLASEEGSAAFGYNAVAEGYACAAFGSGKATASYAHAEGVATEAAGEGAHAEGRGTIAAGAYQHVQGAYNVADDTSAFIIGNGNADARSNAFTVDWDGNVAAAGSMKLNKTEEVATTAVTGLLSRLETSDKTNLVSAINELNGARITQLQVQQGEDLEEALNRATSSGVYAISDLSRLSANSMDFRYSLLFVTKRDEVVTGRQNIYTSCQVFMDCEGNVKRREIVQSTNGQGGQNTTEFGPWEELSPFRVQDKEALAGKADMKNEYGGFVGGDNLDVSGNTTTGAAVGRETFASTGLAGGDSAKCIGGGAACGSGTVVSDGFSGGKNAQCIGDYPIDAIQLGTGTNSNEKTLQVYSYQLMDASGNVPAERIRQAVLELLREQGIVS